jgi:hypothetical protein
VEPLPRQAQEPGELCLGAALPRVRANPAEEFVPQRSVRPRAQREAPTKAAGMAAGGGAGRAPFPPTGRTGPGRRDEFMNIRNRGTVDSRTKRGHGESVI